jgi:hypothetical protein
MNRILDRKVAAAGFDVGLFVARAVACIQLETASANGDKLVDYAEVADSCQRLLMTISQYNTLVRTRAELGE